jgi:hypothetical protein
VPAVDPPRDRRPPDPTLWQSLPGEQWLGAGTLRPPEGTLPGQDPCLTGVRSRDGFPAPESADPRGQLASVRWRGCVPMSFARLHGCGAAAGAKGPIEPASQGQSLGCARDYFGGPIVLHLPFAPRPVRLPFERSPRCLHRGEASAEFGETPPAFPRVPQSLPPLAVPTVLRCRRKFRAWSFSIVSRHPNARIF